MKKRKKKRKKKSKNKAAIMVALFFESAVRNLDYFICKSYYNYKERYRKATVRPGL